MFANTRVALAALVLVLVVLTPVAHSPARPVERPEAASAVAVPVAPALEDAALAVTDTLILMGGPDRGDGKFQSDSNPMIPDDEGWLPFSTTREFKWHIDTVNAALLDPSEPENHAMWCGAYFQACTLQEEDPNPGYGAGWDEWLTWSGTVSAPGDTTLVTLTAMLNYDNEAGYDYVDLELVEPADSYTTLLSHWGNNMVGGVFEPVAVDVTFAVPPSSYRGAGGDEIHLRWRVTSDGAFDDSNCMYPSVGAAQVDNIAVSFDQGGGPVPQTYDDFETGSPVHWIPDSDYNCGNGKVWTGLVDGELCRQTNLTPQVAFINDGTGCSEVPSYGIVADYGPDGMVVDCWRLRDGESSLVSPPMALPDMTDYETVSVEYDVFLHGFETFTPVGYVSARVSEDGGGTWSPWGWGQTTGWDRPFRGRYRQTIHGIGDGYPAADTIQLKISAEQFSSYYCTEGTPAPYFDNIAVRVFKHAGPHLAALSYSWEDHLAVDAFPAGGGLDLVDPGNNAVPVSQPGAAETISIYAALTRHGAMSVGVPELHWSLKANPLFDAYRTSIPSNPVLGVDMGPPSQTLPYDPVEYAFTLPSTGFVFPGDELHYYFRMQDDVAGDIGTTLLPADTTGFGNFEEMVGEPAGRYAQKYHMRALPGLRAAHPDSQPHILVWDDTGGREFSRDITRSLAQLGYVAGRDYDIYQSGWTTAGGLFAFTTAAQMAGYTTLIYGCASDYIALANEDLYQFTQWLGLGNRNLLFMGDNLLERSENRLNTLRPYLGADLLDRDVLPLIDLQTYAEVVPTGAVPGFATAMRADVLLCESFDAMVPYDTGQALLEFTDPNGTAGVYSVAAGVYNVHAATGTRAITLPIAYDNLNTPADHPGGLSARTTFLAEVLDHFGHAGTSAPSGTTTPVMFRTRAYPNPFNPRTRIDYAMPQAGHLAITIYNVKCQKVRTLLDRTVPVGAGHVDWDGTDDRGRATASGVYFRVSEALGEREVEKMALVR